MEGKQPTINEVLSVIQKQLVAPKDKDNKFGGFKYRSAESILDEVKSLLPDGFNVTCSDELVMIGDRYYIRATAHLDGGDEGKTTIAYAREPESQKGMNESQITGSASSYARKYALQGLFAISDPSDDPDSKDNSVTTADKISQSKTELPWLNEPNLSKAVESIRSGEYKAEVVKTKYRVSKTNWALLEAAERESSMDNQFNQTV